MITRIAVFLAAVFPVAAAPNPAPVGNTCAVAASAPCVIDLHGPAAPAMSANCTAEPWSRYVRPLLPKRFEDADKNRWWETVVEVAVDPAKGCSCVRFHIQFAAPVNRWLVNIGDSPTNNGYGGDAGTTQFAAELEVANQVQGTQQNLNVYSAVSSRVGTLRFDNILQASLPELGGRTANIEICDQVVTFDLPGGLAGAKPLHWKLQTPVFGLLYALAPRLGPLGTIEASPKDRGVYAGFNRVVGHSSADGLRLGTGVRRVEITLSP